MKYLIPFLILAGCTSTQYNVPYSSGPKFQAYGILYSPSLPLDPSYPLNNVSMQYILANQLTVIQANYLYYGSPSDYSIVNNSWSPSKLGLYYMDEQLAVYTTSIVSPSYTVQLNLNGNGYLWYSGQWNVTPGVLTKNNARINSLVCIKNPGDHIEALASISIDANIVSQESQFEGYYVGDCL